MSRFLAPVIESVNVGGADKTFTADLTVSRVVLDVGEIARVSGISIANSSKDPAEVTFVDGVNDIKFIETVPGRNTHTIPLVFDTSGGLTAEGLTGIQAADVFISVFYTTNF